MFSCLCRRRKRKFQVDVEPGDKQSTSPEQSVTVVVDLKQEPEVLHTPASSATTVSAPPEAPKEKTKKTSWWRRLLRRKKKTKRQPVTEDVAEDTNLPSSTTENSADTIMEYEGGEAAVLEASPTPPTPVSAATELQPERDDVSTINWSDDEGADVHEASPTPPTPVSAATELQPERDNLLTISWSDGGGADVQEASSTPLTPISAATVLQPERDDVSTISWSDGEGADVHEASEEELMSVSSVETDDEAETSPPSEPATALTLPADRPVSRLSIPAGHGGSLQVEPDIGVLALADQLLSASASTEKLSREELVCLGLPNLAQTCYMNSTLQGLLTLTPFIQEVYSQQEVWSSHPNSQFIREFVDVAVCRFTNDKAEKKYVLAAFKRTVAEYNSEFDDDSQKDAHEFLSCVLDMLRSLSYDLHTAAVDMGLSYTCPVDAHIAFQMLSTRTCKGCGVQSVRQEYSMNLFLDLVPGGSVSTSLQDYLKESSLEFRCECGAEESTRQHSFLTLPNVLILQLQRFKFTSSFNLKKVNRPIVLSRELVVNPGRSVTEQTRYSLVSIISHLGPTAHSGHYICDSSYCQQQPHGVTDRWLTYNDSNTSETTGHAVCKQRQQTAYLLFYEKQE